MEDYRADVELKNKYFELHFIKLNDTDISTGQVDYERSLLELIKHLIVFRDPKCIKLLFNFVDQIIVLQSVNKQNI